MVGKKKKEKKKIIRNKCTWVVGEKKIEEREQRERGKKFEKRRYFGSCEKNKYIKKWNSNVKIGSLV